MLGNVSPVAAPPIPVASRGIFCERFRGADLAMVYERAKRALGEDVMLLHTRRVRDGGVSLVEVIAARTQEVDRIRRRLEPGKMVLPARAPAASRAAPRLSPYVVALVGPTGSGKTTTAAKLATRAGTFGTAKVGLITLDTFRTAGVEQLALYAELASVPLEVVYDAGDVKGALQRLAACDVIIIDTPGRSPAAAELDASWRAMLAALRPDEVHLVLPATMRADLAIFAAERFRISGMGIALGSPELATTATHLVLSKLDEVPGEHGVADLALTLDLPLRWVTDGQQVPDDLRAGVPRIMRSLGLPPRDERGWSPA
jgi:flagellar biosynthesis protein FlhF